MISPPSHSLSPLPVGIGLRSPHYQEVIRSPHHITAWWEVHSENFFSGGVSLQLLHSIRERYPLSLHGVGLSLGSSGSLNQEHLQKLAYLVERFEPFLVSEHLSWSAAGDIFLNDLLPMPYTEESLATVTGHVVALQDRLNRQILIENPSTYLQFTHSTIPEWEFMAALIKQSGCGLLLDVNNIYVSAINHGFDPEHYLRSIPKEAVQEIHLAGHAQQEYQGHSLLIDNHGSQVAPEVWALYDKALDTIGIVPTLIEWDTDIPALAVLTAEATKIEQRMMRLCS